MVVAHAECSQNLVAARWNSNNRLRVRPNSFCNRERIKQSPLNEMEVSSTLSTCATDHPHATLPARIEALRADLVEMEEENATLRAVADERREDFVRERRRQADGRVVEGDVRPDERDGISGSARPAS
jgi:hypothetical protein